MTIPVGLAPGGIKGAAAYPADHLELPGNAQVARIPSNVQFQSGPLSVSEPLSGNGCGKLKNPATMTPS